DPTRPRPGGGPVPPSYGPSWGRHGGGRQQPAGGRQPASSSVGAARAPPVEFPPARPERTLSCSGPCGASASSTGTQQVTPFGVGQVVTPQASGRHTHHRAYHAGGTSSQRETHTLGGGDGRLDDRGARHSPLVHPQR